MANPQDTQFGGFAGTLIKSGIGTNMPLVALEQGVDSTVFANLDRINGMMPKIKDIFVRQTRVFESPLDRYITRFDERYGAGMEQVAVKYGAYDEKLDGTCMPRGVPELTSQLDMENFAISVDIDIPDYLIDKAVLDEGQRGSVVAALMDAPLKTIAAARYRAWVQLLSNVVDGERSISSKDSYNGYAAKTSAASVTYAPEIVGYAGKLDKIDAVLPPIEVGVQYRINTPKEALDICNKLKSIAADMRFESTEFNKLSIMTFTTSKPLLIAEKKVLDAMDTVFAEYNVNGGSNGNFGYAGFPTVSARAYLSEFSELVEIDSFASLPTNTKAKYEYKTAGYGVKFVLMDRDAMVNIVKNYSVEGMRCAKERSTGYNWRAEEIFSIWRGVDAYAMLAPLAGALTFASGNFTVKIGDDAVTTGTAIPPGTIVTVAGATGYDLSTVTLNGTSLTIADDAVSFAMPQEPAVLVVTTESE